MTRDPVAVLLDQLQADPRCETLPAAEAADLAVRMRSRRSHIPPSAKILTDAESPRGEP